MESDTVSDSDDKKRPMGARVCALSSGIVDGKENVRCIGRNADGLFE